MLSSCNSNSHIVAVDTYNIGETPPHVVNIQLGHEHGYPEADKALPEITFKDFEEKIRETYADNYIIVECEMIEGGTLYCNTEHNYASHVITPVKILKIHDQSESLPYEIKVGDEINVGEPYFWITPEMDGIIEDYEVGTYITTTEYYPMMLGKRYILYANLGEDHEGNKLLTPCMYFNSFCISEDSLHSERLFTYNWSDTLYYTGVWLKYSNKSTFNYEYADVFTETENKSFNVVHVDKSPLEISDNLEDRETAFFNKGNGNEVILSCIAKGDGQQVKVSGNPYLYDYEYCTLTDISITGYYHIGEKVRESLNQRTLKLKLLEPYYMVTEEMTELTDEYEPGAYITHSRYIPTNAMPNQGKHWLDGECIIFAYMTEYNGENVLVVPGLISAVSTERKQQIPEHQQITLGPESLLCYMETKAKYINKLFISS